MGTALLVSSFVLAFWGTVAIGVGGIVWYFGNGDEWV